MAMQDDKSDLFIFDGLFEDKTIDDFFNFSVEDVEEDPTDQLLVMKDPSPAYLSWAAEAQALIANFPPPPPSQPQQQQHQSLMTTVNGDDDTFAAAAVDDFTAKPDDVASFACEDDPELAWFSNFVDDSYSPADAAAPACVDIPSDAATNYSGITAPFQFRAGTTHSTVTNPVVLKEYNDVDEQDFDHHALLCRAARYRTPSPVSVLDRTSAAQGLLGGGTGSQLIIEVPNPKVVHTATSSASTYSSSSSSSPTSSSCSGVVVSGLKMHGPRSPPESFAHVRGRAPRTKRSRPTARPEALLPIVAPPLPSHFASIPADDESQHLLPMPDSSPAPIYIPVPKMSSPSTESTTTTASLPPIDSTLPEDNDNTSSVDCCAPKKKKIKLTITSSAAAAAAAAAPMMHHPATDASGARKCMHCGIQKTPQWRAGPMGPKTLCNACGVRYKSGRLFPEYRPAASPTFVASIHSNSHKKVVEMRNKTTTTTKTGAPAGAPVSSKGCELLNYIRGAAKALPPPPVAAATATAGGSSSDRDW